MRRKENEITDRAVIDEILSGSQVCRIAMVDGDKPYIVPMNYGYKDNTVYFHSSPSGKKIELLKKNNRVCFETELPSQIIRKEISCEWSAKYRSVIGYGTVEFITDPEDKREGLDIIMAHYGKRLGSIYPDTRIRKVLVLKLKIDEITGKQSTDWK
ncbi:MAG: hypothetical protein A2V64_10905 [Bacteroidetes bacterium RBG_13_43_22]|nr:MAG: hypothetical protein A2V64_10905 [Bacteroidetes bacterium RBG_13_43_22]